MQENNKYRPRQGGMKIRSVAVQYIRSRSHYYSDRLLTLITSFSKSSCIRNGLDSQKFTIWGWQLAYKPHIDNEWMNAIKTQNKITNLILALLDLSHSHSHPHPHPQCLCVTFSGIHSPTHQLNLIYHSSTIHYKSWCQEQTCTTMVMVLAIGPMGFSDNSHLLKPKFNSSWIWIQ